MDHTRKLCGGLFRILQVEMSITALLAVALVLPFASATNYNVGDASQWANGVNYVTWVSGKTFLVGDNLVFTYTTQHTVDEVSMTDYNSCSATNPILSNTLSPTTIALNRTGQWFFICGTPGHCSQGMKLALNVSPAGTPMPPGTTNSSPPPPGSTTSSPPPPPSSTTSSPPPPPSSTTSSPPPPPGSTTSSPPPPPGSTTSSPPPPPSSTTSSPPPPPGSTTSSPPPPPTPPPPHGSTTSSPPPPPPSSTTSSPPPPPGSTTSSPPPPPPKSAGSVYVWRMDVLMALAFCVVVVLLSQS